MNINLIGQKYALLYCSYKKNSFILFYVVFNILNLNFEDRRLYENQDV